MFLDLMLEIKSIVPFIKLRIVMCLINDNTKKLVVGEVLGPKSQLVIRNDVIFVCEW